jgi:hypothetical protein
MEFAFQTSEPTKEWKKPSERNEKNPWADHPEMPLDIAPPARGELLAALRLWRGSGHGDNLTLDEVSSLLQSPEAIGMSADAAGEIRAKVEKAHGERCTCEQLVGALIPLARVSDFQDLSKLEEQRMRAQFDGLVDPVEPVTEFTLANIALNVDGLVPTEARGTMATDIKAVCAQLQANTKEPTDLPRIFRLFRAEQKKSRPPPTQQQLLRVLTAFDNDATGTLTMEKVRKLGSAFGDAKGLESVSKSALISVEERTSLSGGWEPRGERGSPDKAEKKKNPPRVNIGTLASSYTAQGSRSSRREGTESRVDRDDSAVDEAARVLYRTDVC